MNKPKFNPRVLKSAKVEEATVGKFHLVKDGKYICSFDSFYEAYQYGARIPHLEGFVVNIFNGPKLA